MTAIATVAPLTSLELASIRARLAAAMARLAAIVRKVGPYAAIEILLPGGTLMAVLLWLCRRGGYARVPVHRPESVAYERLCMECGVANGHFELGSVIKIRSTSPH